MSQPLTVECPTCGAPVEWKSDNKYRPFCSDRCKLIDLGALGRRGTCDPRRHPGRRHLLRRPAASRALNATGQPIRLARSFRGA